MAGGAVPHVELSLSDERGSEDTDPGEPWTRQVSSVQRWARTVAVAEEPCVLLDGDGMIVAGSKACRDLLGTEGPVRTGGTPHGWSGRGLLEVLHLVDLTAAGAPLAAWEAERIPPLLVLATGNLARGLIRIRLGERTRTIDVVSTPLADVGAVVGSLSFLHRI